MSLFYGIGFGAGTALACEAFLRKRPFRFPAAIQPGVNCSLRNPDASSPISYAQNLAVQFHAPVAATVVLVDQLGYPTAVFRAIAKMPFFAVNLKTFFVAVFFGPLEER